MASRTIKFHIHLPGGIENIGQPIVLGDREELGFWQKPIVKLRQPFPENLTYWQSDSITISLPKFSKPNNIKYKFAIRIPTSSTNEEEGENVFEGNSPDDDRMLDIERENQFAIWKNNSDLSQKLNMYIDKIYDYAFVNYIFNSIRFYNLKDKILEYQYLLYYYNEITIHASNIDFIINHIKDDLIIERRIFLCLLLGYYISKQDLNYELPKIFPSELLLDVIDKYKQKNLPSVTKIPMQTAITCLVQHNAFQHQFRWVKIFTVAPEVDPEYIFIYYLKDLNYPNDDLLKRFIKELEIVNPYIKKIEFDIYINLAKWLIELCHNNNALFKLWFDILLHNKAIDNNIFESFIERIQKNISNDDVLALENRFNELPKNIQGYISKAFKYHAIQLLSNLSIKWSYQEISFMKEFLQDDNLNWNKKEIIQSLELISKTDNLELLNIYPEILDNWFRKNFTDIKEKKIPIISNNWFTNLLSKLKNINDKNEDNFVFLMFQQLENIYPLIGYRRNNWNIITNIVINRVKACSETQIISATKFIVELKEQEVKELFSSIIKGVLSEIVQPINDRFVDKIFMMCDCKGDTLKVPNTMCEEILCYIMFTIQNQMFLSDTLEEYLSIIKSSRFWIIMLNATGNVENLKENPYYRRIKMATIELNRLLLEKTINMRLLQQILDFSDEQLFRYFHDTIGEDNKENNFFDDVIISKDEILILRELYNDYEIQLNQLLDFYNGFCSDSKVIDVNNYIRDIRQRMEHSDNVILRQVMTQDYWSFHEKSLQSARNCYELNETLIFRNIYKTNFHDDAAATNVEYIAQKLVPNVIEKYYDACESFKK
ncbi:hypothetical protein RclHR1_03380014 [Rhizophagus clarus]|uniref:CBM20 domain-containing protein n=1 Tax=Rhizophagus clarus TaxID=94130 RepID=A0A2Z6RDE3_9GLOM|nr:hypothetical protein RclHR1_03380014 [Rhizophagus clarus]GES94789.1 hypothetical protein GLOIN_2v1778786 [Rhizophagus clarus]